MQLDPPHARVGIADEHAMADDGSVIVDHGAPQPDDPVAQLFAPGQQIGSDVGAQRMHVGFQFRSQRLQIRLRREVCAHLAELAVHLAEFRAHLAQHPENQAFRLSLIAETYQLCRTASNPTLPGRLFVPDTSGAAGVTKRGSTASPRNSAACSVGGLGPLHLDPARHPGGGQRRNRLGPDLHRRQGRRGGNLAADALGAAVRLRRVSGAPFRRAAQGAALEGRRLRPPARRRTVRSLVHRDPSRLSGRARLARHPGAGVFHRRAGVALAERVAATDADRGRARRRSSA